jgi:hypothetical protein
MYTLSKFEANSSPVQPILHSAKWAEISSSRKQTHEVQHLYHSLTFCGFAENGISWRLVFLPTDSSSFAIRRQECLVTTHRHYSSRKPGKIFPNCIFLSYFTTLSVNQAVQPRMVAWLNILYFPRGHAVACLRHYATSRKVAGSIPDEVNWPNISRRIMALGSTHLLNRNEYQESTWEVKGGRPASKADNLTAICEPII